MTSLFQYDFWKEPRSIGEDTHLMARADRLEELQVELKERGFGFETMIDDVEK